MKKVIGLEIHAQISTKTKLFSRALIDEDASPNSNVEFLDAGMPGSLPVPNEQAVKLALKTCLALNMEINEVSIFDRKHYFYQDSPLGYQITQFYKPIGVNGHLECSFGKIRINRLHIEGDAGKTIYKDGKTYVDLNRAGVPLMEIVTEPDFENEEQVVEFLKELRLILLTVQTCKCNMEKGNLRVDVNLSIHNEGEPYGTRVEIKNLNSFTNIRKAIECEYKDQVKIVGAGGQVKQETKLFDVATLQTRSIRGKEEFVEYAYFPDPDLLPVKLEKSDIEKAQQSLPELPKQMRERYYAAGISKEQAYTITSSFERSSFFNSLLGKLPQEMASKAASWFSAQLMGMLSEDFDDFIVKKPKFLEDFAQIINLCETKALTRANAKELLEMVIADEIDLNKVIKEKGFLESLDIDLDKLIEEFVNSSPDEVKKFKQGKTSIVMFFVGEIMKRTKGKANPDELKEKILKILEKV